MTTRTKAELAEFMRQWGIQAHQRSPYATNHALFGETDIDPAKEAVKARTPLPGQTGRTYYPGQ